MIKMINVTKFLIAASLLMLSAVSLAKDNIVLGMTAALTGDSSALGNEMQRGIVSYFDSVNKQGGVNGRRLQLIVKDDGYEPANAAANMRSLIDDDHVLAIIGNVGTPTAVVTVPIANEKKTLLFGAFSGGDVLRTEPPSRYVINYRPSYKQETVEMVEGLLQTGVQANQIAFFTQRDSYGDAGFAGAKQALVAHGFKNIDQLAHGRYSRNSTNVEGAVATILDATIEPKAIIMAAGYEASAKFIKLLRRDMPNVVFLNLSFVGSHSLKKALGTNVENVIVIQVVPHLNSDVPVVKEYINALVQYDEFLKPNVVSLEGFIIAKIFHQGLLSINGEITRESIIDGLETLTDFNIGLGVNVELNQHDHQATNKLWPSVLKSGRFDAFSWDELSWMNRH
ncbi:ligand-binding receptor [Methylophaga sp. 41_12_T18]|nr:ligand-binding receptor [Methylophaga sp. 41_12_T18]